MSEPRRHYLTAYTRQAGTVTLKVGLPDDAGARVVYAWNSEENGWDRIGHLFPPVPGGRLCLYSDHAPPGETAADLDEGARRLADIWAEQYPRH